MNSLLRHARHFLVALSLVAFLTIQVTADMSPGLITDANGGATILVNCDDETCG